MLRSSFLLLVLALLFIGCGKQLTGRYEGVAEFPQFHIGGDAAFQKQMNDQVKVMQDLNRMTLEFDGSKVRMGNGFSISELKYRIDGSRLEIISEAMGQKTIIPMTIQPDGSILYQTVRFRRVE